MLHRHADFETQRKAPLGFLSDDRVLPPGLGLKRLSGYGFCGSSALNPLNPDSGGAAALPAFGWREAIRTSGATREPLCLHLAQPELEIKTAKPRFWNIL